MSPLMSDWYLCVDTTVMLACCVATDVRLVPVRWHHSDVSLLCRHTDVRLVPVRWHHSDVSLLCPHWCQTGTCALRLPWWASECVCLTRSPTAVVDHTSLQPVPAAKHTGKFLKKRFIFVSKNDLIIKQIFIYLFKNYFFIYKKIIYLFLY